MWFEETYWSFDFFFKFHNTTSCMQGQFPRNWFTWTNSHLFFPTSLIRHDIENWKNMLNKLTRNKRVEKRCVRRKSRLIETALFERALYFQLCTLHENGTTESFESHRLTHPAIHQAASYRWSTALVRKGRNRCGH